MKRRIIVTLTGITMSTMLITTGCAGSTGAGTTSQTKSTVTADQAANSTQAGDAESTDQKSDSAQAGNAESADQKSDSAQADAAGKPDSSGSSEDNSSSAKKQKPGSSTEKSGSSAEAAEELKTVEPSAYAGQTVCGKVTAISDSQITVTLGTYKEKLKKSSSESGAADSNTTESGATDPNTADSGANTPNTTAPSAADSDANVPSTSTAPANGNAGIAEANRGKNGQGKKSSFKSSGEQMTVTIPDSLSDVEIKENYVLSITLDENGNVTAVEVKSKGRNKSGSNQPSGGSKPEKGSNSENNTITDADGTTQL